MLTLATCFEYALSISSSTGDTNNMRKIFKTYLTISITAACLMLALSGTDARANGQIGSGYRTDPTTVTENCDPSGMMGSGSRCEATATATTAGGVMFGSGNRTDMADDSGGTIGSGHLLAVIGDFFISLLG